MKQRVPSLANSAAPNTLELRNRYSLLPVEEIPDQENEDCQEPQETHETHERLTSTWNLRRKTHPEPCDTQETHENREPCDTQETHENRDPSLTEILRSSRRPAPIEPSETANDESKVSHEPRTSQDGMNKPEISNVSCEGNQNELLRFRGKIDGHEAIILLDSGSTHDLISADFVQKHRISSKNLEGEFTVTMADGRISSSVQTYTDPLTLVLPNQREKLAFTVFPLAKYDVILGKPWLSANNPVINYRTNEVQIGDNRPWLARLDSDAPSTDPPGVQLNFISGKQARHALRQGEQGFLAWVSAAEETTVSDSDFRQTIDLTSDSSLEE